MTSPLLSVRGVHTYYGHVAALKGVDLEVGDGEIVALIGSNGAGKSTLMMTIFGKPRAREGSIVFAGRDITQLPTHKIARLNIAQSPEGRRIFPRMTVMENLQMGALAGGGNAAADLERVLTLFPRLAERLGQRGGTLSGGEQQMLAIARALMGRPRLLLLDEPSLGLAPAMINVFFWVAVHAMQELSMALMLYNPSTVVVSTMIWSMWQNGRTADAAVLGVMLTLLSALLLLGGQLLSYLRRNSYQ